MERRSDGFKTKTLPWPCPGIDLGDGNYSGCSGGKDCPVCGGDLARAIKAGNFKKGRDAARERKER